jgi:hypothetical protein
MPFIFLHSNKSFGSTLLALFDGILCVVLKNGVSKTHMSFAERVIEVA